jgi:DNA-binding transcriptional MerR regulator
MAGSQPPQPPPAPSDGENELVAIPRLAERTGVTPRVLRYWEELGLISPTREHGKLRYSPRDTAIARLTKRLVDSGVSLDGLQMLKQLTQRDVRQAGHDHDQAALAELALRILYQRKAFREVTGMDEEHYPEGHPPSPPHGPQGAEPRRGGPGPEGHGPRPNPPPGW